MKNTTPDAAVLQELKELTSRIFQITAIVKKPGNSPTNWVRFSDKKMNKAECEKMLSGRTEAGKSREEKVTLEEFKCIKE
ncbi:DUF1187 family protein [Salmonella enterica subsp. enterica serovar Oranienburg]|nr:DUF1187 family protein [Salmonella enterica subsp. enterica serovar Oranienburg]